MEQYNMKANFYPAQEPKNGYIGFADLTIANAIRMRGIAVFENDGTDGHHIKFPSFGDDVSFVVPSSKEAYAQMLSVIESAVKDPEQHFGWVSGKINPRLEVSGHPVTEPFADARFSIQVADICSLRGVATREVEYAKDGKDDSFISVDLPTLPPYEKDGGKVYPPVFEGLDAKYTVNGVEHKKDFGLLIRNLVLNERKNLLEKESLESQMSNAEQKAGQNIPSHEEPAKAAVR